MANQDQVSTDQRPVHDVLGWGIVAVDDVFCVDEFPAPDAKVQADRAVRRLGGLSSVALLAVADLDGKACYCGALDPDESLSRFVLDSLASGGVNISHTVAPRGARPLHAVIVVAAKDASRTIFYTTQGFVTRPDDDALRALVPQSRVLLVDAFILPGIEAALTAARRNGVPIVADIEVEDPAQLPGVAGMIDHMVVPAGAARALTGSDEPETAARRLAQARAAGVVTLGDRGCWYAAGPDPSDVRHQPAFPVEARNTTGCGDVFHGAYALGVARGWPLERIVRFASASAAVRAEDSAPQGSVTSAARVEELLGAGN